jgi:hypothetical protein
MTLLEYRKIYTVTLYTQFDVDSFAMSEALTPRTALRAVRGFA